jgi:glycosyltransferase involved in cell wall biosynthesis
MEDREAGTPEEEKARMPRRSGAVGRRVTGIYTNPLAEEGSRAIIAGSPFVKLSIIVPAYNEAKRIESCLQHLSQAVAANSDPQLETELIVVDNNSTDATADLARRGAARVVFEPVNQIARARNAGAAEASGDWLLFVDADTLVSAETLRETLGFIGAGRSVGGGTVLRYDRTPLLWKPILLVANAIVFLLRWTCGCYVFCRADAFREFGGYNQELFAGEDVEFGRAMLRWAKPRGLRVAMVRRHPPITSIRKLELYGTPAVLSLMARWLILGRSLERDKSRLQMFYDGKR